MPRVAATIEEKQDRIQKVASLKPLGILKELASLNDDSGAFYKSMNRHFLNNLPRYEAKRKSYFTIREQDQIALKQLCDIFDSLGRKQSKFTYFPFGIFSRLMLLENSTGDSLRREFKGWTRSKRYDYQKSKMPVNEDFKMYIRLTAKIAKSILEIYDARLGNIVKSRQAVRHSSWYNGIPRETNPNVFFSLPQYPRGNFHMSEKDVIVGFRFFTNEMQRQDESFFCSVCNSTMRYGDLYSVGKLYHCNDANQITLLRSPDYAHWECCCPQYDRFVDFQRHHLKVPLKKLQGYEALDEETKSYYSHIRFGFVSATGKDPFARRSKQTKTNQ